jgi:hypothetical protein
MVIEDNLIINNNNADQPIFGMQPAIGAGVEISGGRYHTVRNNTIVDQSSWGVVTHDYPDTEKPPPGSHCQGGFPNVNFLGTKVCDFPARVRGRNVGRWRPACLLITDGQPRRAAVR